MNRPTITNPRLMFNHLQSSPLSPFLHLPKHPQFLRPLFPNIPPHTEHGTLLHWSNQQTPTSIPFSHTSSEDPVLLMTNVPILKKARPGQPPLRLISHLDPPSTTTVPPPALAPSLLHPQPVTTHPPPMSHPSSDPETTLQRPHHALPLFAQHPPVFGLQCGPLLLHSGSTTMSSTSSSFPNTQHSTTTTTRSTCLISTTPTTTRTSTH